MDTLFRWDWEPPVAWQEALSAVAPAGERLSDFRLVWEPGEPESPIQRLTIWQMRSKAYTQQQVRRGIDPRFVGLTDRHPREHARWDRVSGCYRKWGGGMARTDRLTWELYHRTGQYGQRWWVIQGEHGGHRYHLTPTERKLLMIRTRGRQVDIPRAGDLCYAPFDARVLAHVQRLESVAQWHKVCQYADKNEERLDAEEQREAEAAREALTQWLDEQFGETFDTYLPVYREAIRALPSRRALTTKEDRPRPASEEEHARWREEFVKVGT